MKKLVLSLTLLVMSVSAFSATPIKMVAGSAAVLLYGGLFLQEICPDVEYNASDRSCIK